MNARGAFYGTSRAPIDLSFELTFLYFCFEINHQDIYMLLATSILYLYINNYSIKYIIYLIF